MLKRVFLCWSGGLSKIIAEQFYDFLKNNMKGIVKPFFSRQSIEPGELWTPRIMDELQQTGRALIFMTREMVEKAPWVIFEAGAISKHISGSDDQPRVVPILIDVDPEDIPAPLSARQCIEFKKEDVYRVLRNLYGASRRESNRTKIIKREFSSWWPVLFKRVKSHRKNTIYGYGEWNKVSPTQVAGVTQKSPFEAQTAFHVAKKKIVFVGQNLNFLIRSKRGSRVGFWNEIRAFLELDRKRSIEILIMDNQDNIDAINGWSTLFGNQYKQHLDKCVTNLGRWRRYAERVGISRRLKMRLAKFIPPSLTFMDPGFESSLMFLTNPVIREAKAADRPVFLITERNNSKAFQYYWDAYNDVTSVERYSDVGIELVRDI